MYLYMHQEDKHFDRELIRKRLIDFEGLVLKSYTCPTGYISVGVGRNLETNGITEEEAMYLLNNDISTVIKKLDKHWIAWRKLPITAQYVCIDVVFNMGINTWMSFRKTRAYMEMGDFEKAGVELLDSQYAKQVGRRAIFNSEQLKSCKE
jgi:lysozyme